MFPGRPVCILIHQQAVIIRLSYVSLSHSSELCWFLKVTSHCSQSVYPFWNLHSVTADLSWTHTLKPTGKDLGLMQPWTLKIYSEWLFVLNWAFNTESIAIWTKAIQYLHCLNWAKHDLLLESSWADISSIPWKDAFHWVIIIYLYSSFLAIQALCELQFCHCLHYSTLLKFLRR